MAEQVSWSEAREELRKYRETNTRFSERVLELWEDVICDCQHRLGDEIWVILEQVCIAAVDCAQSGIFQGLSCMLCSRTEEETSRSILKYSRPRL